MFTLIRFSCIPQFMQAHAKNACLTNKLFDITNNQHIKTFKTYKGILAKY